MIAPMTNELLRNDLNNLKQRYVHAVDNGKSVVHLLLDMRRIALSPIRYSMSKLLVPPGTPIEYKVVIDVTLLDLKTYIDTVERKYLNAHS